MRSLSYLSALLFVVLLAACGGGGGSPGTTAGNTAQGLFTTAPGTLTLTLGSAQTFNVGGGKGPYTATSNNNAVAVSSLTDNTLTLGAVTPGTAAVTLRDAAGATTSIAITVQPARTLFTTAPSAVVVTLGNTTAQTYQIGGGVGPYVIGNSNPNVVSATLTGTNLTLTGLAVGAANLAILDSAGSSVNLAVTVAPASSLDLFTTAPAAVTIAKGVPTPYSIGGGQPPYSVNSSNLNVATVSQSGSTFTITGVANGAASVVVRDGIGKIVTIAVTVGDAQMSLNPTTVNAFIGDIVYSALTGGTGPYSIVEGFPDAADVDIGTLSGTTFIPNASGNILRVAVKQAVSADIIVIKDSTGNSAIFTLSATAGTNGISLAPNALAIGEEYFGPITLLLKGGVGTVNLFSSNPNLITVGPPVTGSGSGNTTVIVNKTTRQVCTTGEVTITAIDSTGAKATSLITVEDHGNNPDPCPPVAGP